MRRERPEGDRAVKEQEVVKLVDIMDIVGEGWCRAGLSWWI
jgi:hypothetical protein